MQMLETIRRKIDSAQDLHSVVKTMKALAAVNIHAYEKAVQSINNYFQNIISGFQIVLKNNPEILKSPTQQKKGATGILVFGAQRGMAGNFNPPLLNKINSWILERKIDRKSSLIVCALGEKITEQLKDINLFPDQSFDFPDFRYHLDSTIGDLLLLIEQWRTQKKVTNLYLFYNKPVKGTSFKPFIYQLFPMDSKWLKDLISRKWSSRSIPFYTMPTYQLFDQILRQYLFILLYRAFIESIASENASRLLAMQKAEKNIEERLDNLQAQFHHQRQNAITDELLDIIAGFEALTK